MDEKENIVGSESVSDSTQTAETTTANAESVETAQKDTTQENVDLKSFTQDQVNDLIRERIDRERANVYKRYGVTDKVGLDNLIGKSQAYDVIKERYDKLREANAKLTQDNAFISNNINPERQNDILTYFKGKGVEFSNEALVAELQTHPEWLNVVEKSDIPLTTIEKLSAERGFKQTGNERDEMAKLFGLSKLI